MSLSLIQCSNELTDFNVQSQNCVVESILKTKSGKKLRHRTLALIVKDNFKSTYNSYCILLAKQIFLSKQVQVEAFSVEDRLHMIGP